MKKQTSLIIIYSIGLLPFLLNGFYNPILINFQKLYWFVDILSWIVLPIILLYIGINKNLFNFEKLGFNKIINDKYDSETNILLLMLLIILIVPISYFSFEYLYNISKVIFPNNILESNFNYSLILPEYGSKRLFVVLYISLMASIVEEIYCRGLFRLIIDKYKYKFFPYIILSPLIFSFAHWEGGIRNIFSTFTFGFIYSIFYYKIRNIWPLIVGHFITDLLIFL